jgi:cytochrome b involved in lipid metabolism
MRPILEFSITEHPEHKLIAIVPDGKEYLIQLNGKVHYGGTKFTLHDAKEKIDFLRTFLNISETPISRAQDGTVVTKRKRRTKAEMAAARRENDRSRINSTKPKKFRRHAPKTKRNR